MPVKIGLQYIDIWNESLEKQVQKYEAEPIRKGQIVFYGPSNFTRWEREKWDHTPLSEVIVGKSGAKCAINRGFGSSCPEHQLYYYPRMVRPLEPKVLVYSCTNGNGRIFGYTPEESFELAQRVVAYAMADFPDIRVYLVGTQRRREMTEENLAERRAYNAMVREFAESTPNCFYVDALEYEPLQRTDIYVKDGVHYNQEGYDIYGEFFKEVLKDELEKF